jgi:hypothetical protein
MRKFSLGVVALLFVSISAYAVAPIVPQIVLKNNFGEQTKNFVEGGSNQLDINFIVDSTNGNGLGIRSLKGYAAANVYMHTSATPAVGNPNPAAGYILVEFNKAYAGYVSGYSGYNSPVSGTPINVTTGVTAGLAYIVTSVGTTTAAGFQALGLPLGLTPTVGQAFIAPATATTTGTGQIEVPAAAGSASDHIELVGDPNQTSNPSVAGASVVLVNLAATSSSVTTFVATAPANNSVIGLRFTMGQIPTGI